MEQKAEDDAVQELPVAREKRDKIYEVEPSSGHYGACYKLVQDKQGADPSTYTGIWNNIHHGLDDPYRAVLSTYWMASLRDVEDGDHNYKEHQLPLARIKKVMKADPEVKMISAEAPILFAKGCDIFITELTMRAWIHAEENKRRTLQRSDIAAALSKSDMFDFLIDIVPREEANAQFNKRSAGQSQQAAAAAAAASQAPSTMPPQAQQMAPPPAPQHAPQQHEYAHYAPPPDHDPYRQQHPMYAQDPAYGHQQMAYDPNQGMYPPYGMQPSQMYSMPMPPRQDHPPAPQQYPQYDTRHQGGDAEGETEDVG